MQHDVHCLDEDERETQMLHPIQERARWAYVTKLLREREEHCNAHRRWMEHNRILLQELLEISDQDVDGVGGITLDYDRNTASVDGMTFLFRDAAGPGFKDSGVSFHLLPARKELEISGYTIDPKDSFDPFQHYSLELRSLEDVGLHLCHFEPHYT